MNLQTVLDYVPFYETTDIEKIKEIEIKGVQVDSRSIKDGELFVCIKGYTVDGHDYVEQAIKNGAVAVVSEKEIDIAVPVIVVSNTSRVLGLIANKYYENPSKKFPLIGITGTNGKTTITYLLESIYNAHKQKTGVIGTIQMKIGHDVYPVANTTPDALSLQKSFYQMHEEKVDTAIIEVSSHALDLGRVHGVDFDVAIFTNLSQDHLDYHEDMRDYLFAKSLLFSQLGNVYEDSKPKFAILNADDEHMEFLKKSTAQPVVTYSRTKKADVYATDIELEVTHTRFNMHTPKGSVQIDSNLIGMFNVSNMLAASAAALMQDIPLETIKIALENLEGVDGRFEAVTAGQSFACIVDYAHTPDSLENVLQTVNEFVKGKVYVVVGCGGDRDRTKRPLMANIAVKYADLAILTSDNPRTEDPTRILEDMTADLKSDHYLTIESREQAIQHAVEIAEDGDIIVIAGKGHETYQIIGHTKYDFDDRVIAKQAIEKKVK